MKRTLYDDLGVRRNATKQEIAKAYKNLAKRYHPDLQVNESAKKKAEKEMVQINIAYETLKDEEKRREYDNKLLAEAEAQRIARERARQGTTANNVRPTYNVNNYQNREIKYEYVSPIKRINFDLVLKICMGIGILAVILEVLILIPSTREWIANFYENNIIFKMIIDLLIAIVSAFKSTISFIIKSISKGTF